MATIRTGPIKDYWRAHGLNLEEDHPEFPNCFVRNRCCRCGLHFFAPVIIGGPTLYRALSKHEWYYAPHKWEFAEALTWLSQARPNRLVELGCGEGHFLHQARRFATEVVGTELNPDAARKCRLNGLEVHEATVDDLDGRFDVITSFQLMEHVDNPGEIVERCVSKLRHDGALIVSVPNQDGIIGELEEDFLNLPPHHASRWERSCFDYIAGHHGLVLEHYAQEPLTFELYANWSFEKLKRLNVGSRLLGRLYNRCVGLLHRALLPGAFARTRGFLSGHTHLAILRKVSDTRRAE